MGNWRETKIGTGVKRPKSPEMKGFNRKKDLKEKLKKQKSKQRFLLKSLTEDIKKISQSGISLDGLETLSSSSISSLQKRRAKSVESLNKSVRELVTVLKSLKTLENQLRDQ